MMLRLILMIVVFSPALVTAKGKFRMIDGSLNERMQENGPMKIWKVGRMMRIIVKEIVNHRLIFDLIFHGTTLG